MSTDIIFAPDNNDAFPPKSKEIVSYSKETQTSGLERTEHPGQLCYSSLCLLRVCCYGGGF